MNWPLLAVAGLGLLFITKSSTTAPATTIVRTKPGEIWRVEAVLSPAPGSAEMVGILQAMTMAGAPVRDQSVKDDGLHLFWDQQAAPVATTLTFPHTVAMGGSTLLMVGAKRVG